MNIKVNAELDNLYDDFMALADDKKRGVVQAAQSLLEAQRAIKALITKNGAGPLPLKGKKNTD